MSKEIKNIIFDLGGVILNIDPKRTIEAFYSLGIKNILNDTGHYYTQDLFYEFEKGKVSKDDFITEIQKISDIKLAESQIINTWNSMLLDVPKKRIEVVKELKKSYNLYLLSNTNEIHKQRYLYNFECEYGFNFNTLFDKAYFSNEIGMRKPDKDIYEYILRDSNLKAGHSVFLDDSLENVNAAKSTGMQGLHVQGNNMIDLVEEFFLC